MPGIQVVDPTLLMTFLLVFARVGGFVFAAPFFSQRTFPLQVKIILITCLSILLVPGLSFDFTMTSWVMMFIGEMVIGLLIGLTTQMLFEALNMAGALIASEMGLSMASIVDASSEHQTTVVSTIMTMIGLSLFLSLNGHALLLMAFKQGFEGLQVGAFFGSEQLLPFLKMVLKEIFLMAAQLAVPLVAVHLFISVSIGLLGRAIPQVNLLAMSMGANALAGIFLLAVVNLEVLHAVHVGMDRMIDVVNQLYRVR